MINLTSVVNEYGGENININPATALALEAAGVLELKRELVLDNGNVTITVYRKAD